MDRRIRYVSKQVQPADKTVTETIPLFQVKANERVLACTVRVLTGNTTGTQTAEVGDGSDTDRFVTTANITINSAGIYDGSGAGFASTGGYLYTTADTVDLLYTADGNSTVSAVFRVTAVIETWPG